MCFKHGEIYASFSLDMGPNPREFRSGDLQCLLQVDRHVLRTLLDLEPLASRERTKRSATHYTALDALFLVVMQRLHSLGFAPKALDGVSAAIHQALQRPVVAGRSDELRLHQTIAGGLAVGPAPEDSAIELIVFLPPIRLHLLQYTGAGQIAGQAELALLGQVARPTLRRAHSARRSR
jgi:hypothetical protein